MSSLLIVGECCLQASPAAQEVAPREQLVRLRRNSEDWPLPGMSAFRSRQEDPGAATVKQATQIQPFRADLHCTLVEMQNAAGE
jgi:hypothetical protein